MAIADTPHCERYAGSTTFVGWISLPAQMIYRCDACAHEMWLISSPAAHHQPPPHVKPEAQQPPQQQQQPQPLTTKTRTAQKQRPTSRPALAFVISHSAYGKLLMAVQMQRLLKS